MHFLLLAFTLTLLSPLRSVQFTAEDGLSSNNVIAIQQDLKGFMWFGTENGLTRFDGAHATVYKVQNGLPNNLVTSLACDSKGRLWAGTKEGLCVLSDGRFVSWLYKDKGNYVRALHAMANGSVWVAYFDSHLDLFSFSDGKMTLQESIYYDMPSTIEGEYWYQQIFEDRDGILWLGGRRESAEMVKEGINHNLDGRIIGNFAQTENGTIWGYDDFHPMLTRFDGKRFVDAFKIPVSHARLLCDKKGRLWAAGMYGLALIDTETGKSRLFFTEHNFNCIYQDSAGNIWLGGERGAMLLSEIMNQVQSFDKGKEITAILQDKSGKIWTADGSKRESCLYEDSAGTIYLGLWTNQGFYSINPATGSRTLHSLTGERSRANWYTDFLEDSRGRFWAATWECWGLNEFDRKTGRFTPTNPLHADVGGVPSSARLANCLLEDSSGRIWYGTTESGLWCFSPDLKILDSYFSGEYITCLAEIGNTILVGTKAGLFALPGHDRTPILDMAISSIEVDNSSHIWVSTIEGLYLLTTDGPAKVRKFLGFNSEDYGIKVSCRLNDGSLAFGGKNGYNIFNPDSLLAACQVPDILISSLSLTRNSINLQFGTNDYASGRYAQYRYRLQGFEEGWTKTRWPNLQLRYAGLSTGKYMVEIQCTDALGRWTGQWRMPFISRAPLLLTWPFILLYLLLLSGGIALTIRLRERKLRREKAELELAVTHKTEELRDFFSIIAHDVKGPIVGMKTLSETLSANIGTLDKESVRIAVEQMAKSSERTAEMLDSILLWALSQKGMINPEKKKYKLVDLVNEAIGSEESQAAAKGLKIVTQIPDCEIITDRNLFLTVLRNLLTNAIKFTRENGSVRVESDGKVFSVCDSGVGMAEEATRKLFRLDSKISTPGTSGEKGSGLGLILCKELLDRLGETITVESALGKGSKFTISLNQV
jgi:signal transduction histidine kinase/ligand-binding sensor domain-containing protein